MCGQGNGNLPTLLNFSLEMEPHRFGRKLGIGLRVASRIVQQRAASSSATSVSHASTTTLENHGKVVAQKGKRVAEGGRRFGRALLGPFAHVASVLWLQITGVFFALFALFFLQSLWKVRTAYASGPDHQKFLLYIVLSLIFLYFCISSFFRARRKEKRRT
jgi:hypothetical protein